MNNIKHENKGYDRVLPKGDFGSSGNKFKPRNVQEYRINQPTISIPKYHYIDFTKVNSFEDMKLLMEVFLGEANISENHKDFNKVKKLLKEI